MSRNRRRLVRYAGEVGDEGKRELYTGARALLMPIRWAEPFGMVMVEAMACGTPVIAFPEGSAPEVVSDGETGFLVDDEDAMARAVGRLGEIERERCRASVRERFDVPSIVARYERVDRVIQTDIAVLSRRLYPAIVRRGLVPAMQSLTDEFDNTLDLELKLLH